jgi:hypothetical protein
MSGPLVKGRLPIFITAGRGVIVAVAAAAIAVVVSILITTSR